jgi:hypothetical protein
MTSSEAFIWNGFTYAWDAQPHRLSILGSRFGPVHLRGSAIEAEHEFALRIGALPPDEAEFQVPFMAVRTGDVFIGMGTTPVVRLRSKIETSSNRINMIRVGVKELRAHFGDMASVNKTDMSRVKVLLNGFHLEAKSAHVGWHFGGLAISVYGAEWRSEDEIEFSLYTYVRPAFSPEPVHTGYDDWTRAEDCTYDVVVDYAIVAGAPENVAFVDRTEELNADNAVEASLRTPQTVGIRISEERFQYREAFLGMYGFEFYVSSASKNRTPDTGRYIRRLAAHVREFSWEAAKQHGSFERALEFSNDAAFPVKWSLEAQHHSALIGVNGSFSRRQQIVKGRTANNCVITTQMVRAFD